MRDSDNSGDFQLYYEQPSGKLFLGDAVKWLQLQDSECADLIFADPPYNIKKTEWDDFHSQDDYLNWCLSWVGEAARILKSSGSMYLCGFSEILAELKKPISRYFHSCRWLVWHYRNKGNLGKDWGRSHESILHFRKSSQFTLRMDNIRIPYGRHTLKYPQHPQAETSQFARGEKVLDDWQPNPLGAKPKDVIEIPTICNGMEEKTPHPTQKPEELLRKLVLAASDEGQLVLDPFSGSGTTLVAAEQLGRQWLGCDLSYEYNQWAIERIQRVKKMSVADWIELDRKNADRRTRMR